jgi:hypothetical protein
MKPVIIALIDILRDALTGESEEETVRRIVAAAFESGVPSFLLAEYLTKDAAANAELTADLAQALKRRRGF